MPKAKTLINSILILFILFSIPVTVMVAQRSSNIGSEASEADFGLQISPSIQAISRGGAATYTLELNFPDSNVQSDTPVLLHFSTLPKGVTITGQPIGAAPSNNFQKEHLFQVAVDPSADKGTYKVDVTATDMNKNASASFSISVK